MWRDVKIIINNHVHIINVSGWVSRITNIASTKLVMKIFFIEDVATFLCFVRHYYYKSECLFEWGWTEKEK